MKTSVSIAKVNYHSFLHNAREELKQAKTIYPEYTKNNFCNLSADKARFKFERLYASTIKKVTGRTRRADKKNTLVEAVTVISPTTTFKELELLSLEYEKILGFKCLQIALHRDEGHLDKENQFIVNNHAHFSFFTLDLSNGRQLFRRELLTKSKLSKLQTITANILQMERGTPKTETGNFHLNHREYKKMRMQVDKERAALEIENKNKIYSSLIYKETNERVPFSVLASLRKQEIKKLSETIKEKDEKINKLENIEDELEKIKNVNEDLEFENKALSSMVELAEETRLTNDYELNIIIAETFLHDKFLTPTQFKKYSNVNNKKEDEIIKEYKNYLEKTCLIKDEKINKNNDTENEKTININNNRLR